jgi:hypothetical protein
MSEQNNTQGKATENEAGELHGLVCRMLLKMLKHADQGTLVERDKDGELVYIMPPPALLAQAIKFLKDNGIDRPAMPMKREDTLSKKMPDMDELERGNVVSIRR